MNALEDPIVLFIKFGSEENIKSLYENGIVYLNTIEYFQNLRTKELEEINMKVHSTLKTMRVPKS
tara:strand:- start:721 stop:915 length:195 start_codon:yes stop_codon:yes gene_type:complete